MGEVRSFMETKDIGDSESVAHVFIDAAFVRWKTSNCNVDISKTSIFHTLKL